MFFADLSRFHSILLDTSVQRQSLPHHGRTCNAWADLKKKLPGSVLAFQGIGCFFTDGVDSGVRAAACNQAGMNLLIQRFILLHFVQKGGTGFGWSVNTL